jgi:predicted DNA-binding protein (MmcQ/YjbR family)
VRLRAVCGRLAGAVETTTFGHPTFQVRRKTFVVLDDHEHGDALWIVFKATLADQGSLLKDPRFRPSKFGGPKGWTSMRVDAGIDWSQVETVVTASYRLYAGKRLLASLGRESP